MNNTNATEKEYEQVKQGRCPYCERTLRIPHGMTFFKGLYFSKLICDHCDKEWANPKDVMLEHADDVLDKDRN